MSEVQTFLDSLELPEDRLLLTALRGGFVRLEDELLASRGHLLEAAVDRAGDLVAVVYRPNHKRSRETVLILQRFYMINRPQLAADLLKAVELLANAVIDSTTGEGPGE